MQAKRLYNTGVSLLKVPGHPHEAVGCKKLSVLLKLFNLLKAFFDFFCADFLVTGILFKYSRHNLIMGFTFVHPDDVIRGVVNNMN